MLGHDASAQAGSKQRRLRKLGGDARSISKPSSTASLNNLNSNDDSNSENRENGESGVNDDGTVGSAALGGEHLPRLVGSSVWVSPGAAKAVWACVQVS